VKNAELAHIDERAVAGVPRGWVVLAAALFAWVVILGIGSAGMQIFAALI
jgi:hypothetical protein